MLTLLVVDDEERTRRGLCEAVPWREHGIEVLGSEPDAYAALDRIEDTIPDILLLDIRMPEMDGIELLDILRDRYPGIRVILISGYEDFDYAKRAVDSHAFAYLLKPLDDAALLEKVGAARDEILEERRKLEEDASLRREYESWLPTIRNNLLLEIVRGGRPSTSSAVERAAACGIDLHAEECLVALLEREPFTRGGKSADGYRSFAVQREADRFLSGIAGCHTFDTPDASGLLLTAEDIDEEGVCRALDRLRVWANRSVGVSLTIGVGVKVRSIEELPRSYESALRALSLKVISGRNTVLPASRYPSGEDVDALSPLDKRLESAGRRIPQLIRTQDARELRRILEGIADDLESMLKADPSRWSRSLYRISYFIMRMRFELGLDYADDLELTVREVQTLEDLRAALPKVFMSSMEQWQKLQGCSNSNIVRRALGYIHSHVREDISLTTVAGVVGVHPNYLSTLFRSNVGMTFMSYERDVKMREAQRLLRETNLKVYEIANSLQYRDVNHFTKMFKKYTGCSPGEYRNLT